ncbi:MAG: carboxypeptidase-like regulatory domain-containing protein [Clostridium sp.]|uniref:carboxypeptidase-like regulatory domain-containing protein n=1 Tax=Clostridium sp. TaxID=1506 RepID=UPI003F40FF3D
MSYLDKKVYPLTTGSSGTLDAGANKYLGLAAFNLSAPYTIVDEGVYGIVTDGTNPIANAYVALKPSSGTDVYMVQTDANGAFTITAPPASGYQINIIASGFDVKTTGSITVTASTYNNLGTTTLVSDTELTTGRKAVVGKFKLAAGTAIEDGIVSIFDMTVPASPVLVGVTVTNADGNYAFIGLDGTISYKVVAMTSTINPAELDVTFGAGVFTTLADLVGVPVTGSTSSLIQGIARDDLGVALANTSVMLFTGTSPNGTGVAFTKTDAAGYYNFVVPTDVATRDYYVTATDNVPA